MIPSSSPARASPSPAPPGSSAPRSVERLLRCVPGCELVLLVRPGRRSTVEQRAQREIFSNDAFDRLRERARQGRLRRRWSTGGVTADRRRRRHRRARPRRRRAAPRSRACDIVIHSAATVSFDSPARRRGRGQPARPDPHRRRRCTTSASRPHLVAVSTCYVAGNRRGRGARDPRAREPVLHRRRLARRGRRRPPGARRRRGREPPTRAARALPQGGPRTSSAPPASPLLAAKTEQLRAARG